MRSGWMLLGKIIASHFEDISLPGPAIDAKDVAVISTTTLMNIIRAKSV